MPLRMMKKKVKEYGIQLAIKMCNKLIANGAPGLHFYTMNEDYSSKQILEGIDWTLAPGKKQSERPRSEPRERKRQNNESSGSSGGPSGTSLAIAAIVVAICAIVSKSWHWW